MKIKIIEPGYEGFTGQFGTVDFVDGVSEELSSAEVNLLASIVKVVDVETEQETGNLAVEAAAYKVVAEHVNYPTLAEIASGAQPEGVVAAAVAQVQEQKQPEAWTREALEEVADKGGIGALRKIGDVLKVRGTSIAKLIDAILAAQAPQVTVSEAGE